MMSITCPHCGSRPEAEFTCGGQSHIQRPPLACSDAEWGEYLFFRDNPRGPFAERWVHALGCRRWFNAIRDTVTYRFHRIYRLDEEKPAIP